MIIYNIIETLNNNIIVYNYILKLQTWNLLNAWRNTHGVEAQSDELLRIFKLMNSNRNENEIYNNLVTLKLTSNILRI